MSFRPGKPKTGGRMRGTPNKATRDIKEFARSVLESPNYRASLKKRLICGNAPKIEELLYHYAFGRPVERTEVTGEDGAIKITDPFTQELIKALEDVESKESYLARTKHHAEQFLNIGPPKIGVERTRGQ